MSKLVMETAQRAVDLTKLGTQTQTTSFVAKGAIWPLHQDVPAPPATSSQPMQTDGPPTTASSYLSQWQDRYQRWMQEVYEDKTTPTPTPQQTHVLLSIHYRAVKEEYALAGEAIPYDTWSSKPSDIDVASAHSCG